MRFRASLALTCLAVLPPLAAQQHSNLSGLVLDTSGGGIPDAIVSAVNEDTGFRRTAYSQPGGGYVIASLHPGNYKITVRKEGFRSLIRFGVKLDVSQPARVDFTLPVGDVRESITVEASAPALSAEDASVGTLVSRDRIEHLPLNGRGLLSLLELAPGAVVTPATRGEAGQFTANGQRPNMHYFTVDGVSVNTGVSGGGLPAQCTGGSLPGMTAFGSLHSIISLDALEEFRAQTSTVTPAFGRLPGVQVSISSRTGSNELHGSIFEYFRHEKLAANDWFANRHGDPRAPLRANDFGATLGGPLRHDRFFFFLAYEGMRLRQPFAWRAPVPSLASRRSAAEWIQPLADFFPAPNGMAFNADLAEWTGRNHRPAQLDAASLRIDGSITSSITAFARYHQAPSTSEFGSTQVNRLALRSRSLTAGIDLRLRPGLVVDARVNASGAAADSVWSQTAPAAACSSLSATGSALRIPDICGRLVRLSVAGVGQVAWGPEGRRRQGQWQYLNSIHLNAGGHQLRLGFDYRRLSPRYRDAGSLSLVAENIADLESTRNIWISISEPEQGRSLASEYSWFAQDTWRITPRLTATYGVRWEFSPAPSADHSAYFLDPQQNVVERLERDIWTPHYRNLAPRLGFAYRLDGETVLRAGAGLYYASSLSLATDIINAGPLSVRQFGSSRSAPFPSILSYGFLPDFRLPVVTHWNVSIEHAFSGHDTASLAYAGSAGRRLVRREMGGPGNRPNVYVALATNHGRSDYHSLQLQYRRRYARRFQSLLSYSWSHSIDDSSSDSLLHWAGAGLSPARDRGSSDFDVRHALAAAFTCEMPRGWALDGMVRARAGFPLDVLNAENPMGLNFANVFRPDLVAGQPIWISDASAPRGSRLNRAAFKATPELVQGTLGRNAITGFGMSQVDLALRKEFAIRERRSVQFRLEAFNVLNQANFGDPTRFLASPLFGSARSMLNVMLGTGSPGSGLAPMFQIGGARSVQIGIRFSY